MNANPPPSDPLPAPGEGEGWRDRTLTVRAYRWDGEAQPPGTRRLEGRFVGPATLIVPVSINSHVRLLPGEWAILLPRRSGGLRLTNDQFRAVFGDPDQEPAAP